MVGENDDRLSKLAQIKKIDVLLRPNDQDSWEQKIKNEIGMTKIEM